MKKLTLALMSTMAMGTSIMAESYPAYGPDSYLAIHGGDREYTEGGFYLGGAYGHMNANNDWSGQIFNVNGISETILGTDKYDLSSFMFQAGYKINQYLALESRLWSVFGDIDYTSINTVRDISGSIDSDGENVWGFYVKPMYPVTDKLDIYSLLGYVHFNEDFLDESGFSWGLGASYSIADNISVFADYVRLYTDTKNETVLGNNLAFDMMIDTLNFGVSYKF